MLGASLAVCPLAQAAAEQPANPHAIQRLRSGVPAITALIARGTDRSPTFRRLVETIHASDGIVYVEEGPCGLGAHGCLKGIAGSGQNRILFVWISHLSTRHDHDLIATIGHELRHTIEILSNPSVTTTLALQAFYEREGFKRPGWRTFETIAAMETEDTVRAELHQR